jgi:plastocyanin
MKRLVGSKIRLLAGLTILLAVFCISGSCTKKTDTPGPNEVFIQNMAFEPGTITVTANTTLIWINKDALAHTVTSNTGLFDSGSISTNATFTCLFITPGSYPYHCSIHPSMSGTVIVNQ